MSGGTGTGYDPIVLLFLLVLLPFVLLCPLCLFISDYSVIAAVSVSLFISFIWLWSL